MFFSDRTALSKRVAESKNMLYTLVRVFQIPAVESRLKQLNTSREHAVIFSEEWHPIDPPRQDYIGITRSYSKHLKVVELKNSAAKEVGLTPHALLGHELVHVVGGTELDAEVVENLWSRMYGGNAYITKGELEQFWREPVGSFVTLGKSRDRRGRVLTFQGEPMWAFP